MHRRGFLQGVAVGAVTSLAGCGGTIGDFVSSATGGGRALGDTANYNGVEVTPDKYVIADRAERVYAHNRQNISSADGASFLFTHLQVSHNGDSAEEFPKSRARDNIDLYYDNDRVTESSRDDITHSYIVGGKRLTTYGHARQKEGATGEVYPGKSVNGWLLHELASNFDPSKLELRIVWNHQMLGDEGETTYRWMYTSEAKVSIEDLEDSSNDNTISI